MDFRSLLVHPARKYALTILIFLVWMGLLDQNNWLRMRKLRQQENRLKAQVSYYEDQMEALNRKMAELEAPGAMERFARETYLMKREDEVVFYVAP